TASATGLTTTRDTLPHTPSVQRASVPMVICVDSGTLNLRHRGLDPTAVQCPGYPPRTPGGLRGTGGAGPVRRFHAATAVSGRRWPCDSRGVLLGGKAHRGWP